MKHATTPCALCNEPVVMVSVDGSVFALDLEARVFHRIVDPESSPPTGFWIEDKAPSGESRQSLAKHRCRA